MNKSIKAKWLEALRSGKYKQGRGNLRHDGCHCVLGVLCEVVDPDWKPTMDDDNSWYGVPPEIFDASGLRNRDPAKLVGMNDALGKSFNQLADYIERSL